MILRWGIIGLGKIANHFAKDLLLLEGHTLQAVASRSEGKAKTFSDKFGAIDFYSDYHDLIHDEAVDIIYIATPHNSHMEWSVKAMEAGKHVLCEKPLAVNESQVRKMVDTARDSGVFLMEAFWTRFNPVIENIIQKISEGEIGAVKNVNVDFHFKSDQPTDHRLFNPRLAGGALLDVGVYPIFLSYLLLGYPKEVIAKSIAHKAGVDHQTSAIMIHENGIGTISCGLSSDSHMSARIGGSEGYIVINPRWHESESYCIVTSDESQKIEVSKIGRGYAHEIIECKKCIVAGKLESDNWSHNDSLSIIKIADDIRAQINLKFPFE